MPPKAEYFRLPNISMMGQEIRQPQVCMVPSIVADKVIFRFEGNTGLAGKLLDSQPDKLVDIEMVKDLHKSTGRVIDEYRKLHNTPSL